MGNRMVNHEKHEKHERGGIGISIFVCLVYFVVHPGRIENPTELRGILDCCGLQPPIHARIPAVRFPFFVPSRGSDCPAHRALRSSRHNRR